MNVDGDLDGGIRGSAHGMEEALYSTLQYDTIGRF